MALTYDDKISHFYEKGNRQMSSEVRRMHETCRRW